jgi:hypothetical protein
MMGVTRSLEGLGVYERVKYPVLKCSQDPSRGPYFELDESSPHPATGFLEGPF